VSSPEKAEVVRGADKFARTAALGAKDGRLPVLIVRRVDVECRSESVIAERVHLIAALGTVALRARGLTALIAWVVGAIEGTN